MSIEVSRRAFVRQASAVGLAGFLSLTDGRPYAPELSGTDPDLVLAPDEGEVYLIGERQGRVTIKVDKREKGIDSLSLLTEDIVRGDGIPVHKHGAEEELIYVERGRGVLTFGDTEHDVVPGSMALVPRGVWHGLRNTGEEMLRMVFGYSPAGFEGYFREIGVRPGEPWKDLSGDDWQRINEKYNVVYR